MVKLGDVCEIISGATPSTSVKENWGDDYYWATPKDLSSLNIQTIDKTDRKISEKGLKSCSANLLPINSVLFSSRAPIGLVAINTVPIATNQGFKSFIPNPEYLDAKYLYYWLKKNKKNIDAMGVGATFKEVSKTIVARIEFPLPALVYQKRIAAILDQADEIRRDRELAITKLDQLAQSIFVEMFGDPVTNDKKHEYLCVQDIALKITDGEHLNPDFSDQGMPIIMAGNVLESSIDFGSAKNVKLEIGDKFRRKCNPERNDLLVVSRGATIGRMTVVKDTTAFCLMGSVILLKLNKKKVDPFYLSTLLKFPVMRSALFKASGSSAQQAIYLKDLKNLKCIVPPIALQEEFSSRIKAVEQLKADNNAALAKHNTLFASLQHSAFTGQL